MTFPEILSLMVHCCTCSNCLISCYMFVLVLLSFPVGIVPFFKYFFRPRYWILIFVFFVSVIKYISGQMKESYFFKFQTILQNKIRGPPEPVLVTCSRFSEKKYFIHFTSCPMLIFNPLRQDFLYSHIFVTVKSTTNLWPYSRQTCFQRNSIDKIDLK